MQAEIIDLSLPYITSDVPGIGGRLRAKPEHFVVREAPLYDPVGEGEHLYINVTKVNQTTKDVQASLAKLFHIDRRDVGFAGLKDKQAQTTQTFSVHVGLQPEEYAEEAIQRVEDSLDVQVNWAAFHRNKLKTGHLLGNEFSIVVSDVTCESDECLARCERMVELIRTRGIPNFFGPQRFGYQGGNVQQGTDILKGTVHKRDKWMRKFLVGSVQSYLCNLYLAERLERGLFDTILDGDVAKKYETGGIFVVEDAEVEQSRYEAREISFTAPLFGPKMRDAQEQSAELENEILARSGLTVDEFKRQGVSGSRRLGRLLIDDLQIASVDEGIRLSFFLPKGAYATTVLRELMKTDDALSATELDENDS